MHLGRGAVLPAIVGSPTGVRRPVGRDPSWDPMRDGRVLVVTGTRDQVGRPRCRSWSVKRHAPDVASCTFPMTCTPRRHWIWSEDPWLVSIDDVEGLGVDGEAALVKCPRREPMSSWSCRPCGHTVALRIAARSRASCPRMCRAPPTGEPTRRRPLWGTHRAGRHPDTGPRRFLRRGRTSEIQIACPPPTKPPSQHLLPDHPRRGRHGTQISHRDTPIPVVGSEMSPRPNTSRTATHLYL